MYKMTEQIRELEHPSPAPQFFPLPNTSPEATRERTDSRGFYSHSANSGLEKETRTLSGTFLILTIIVRGRYYYTFLNIGKWRLRGGAKLS